MSSTEVFSCGICEIVKKTYFEENLWTTASKTCSNLKPVQVFSTCTKDLFLMKLQIYRVNNFIKKDIRAQIFSREFCQISRNTFSKDPFGWLLPHKHSFFLLSHHDLLFFQKRSHTCFPTEYFVGSFCRLGTRVSSIFHTLSQTPIFNPVEHLNLMVRLQNVLKAMSSKLLKGILARRFGKTSWRRFEDVLKTSWQEVLKTYGQDEYIDLDQDILKTFWRRLLRTKAKDVFKKSSSRRMFNGRCERICLYVRVCF